MCTALVFSLFIVAVNNLVHVVNSLLISATWLVVATTGIFVLVTRALSLSSLAGLKNLQPWRSSPDGLVTR